MDPESDHTEGSSPRLVLRYGLIVFCGYVVTTRLERSGRVRQILLADEQNVSVKC